MNTQEKKYQFLHYLFAGVLFLLIGFLVNKDIKISGLYMDDLYLWSCFGETKLFAYLFPIGSQRFRFVFNVLAYLVLKTTGPNLFMIVPVNIVINAFIAWCVFFISYEISNSRWVGYYTGTAYLISHFAYYQIGQLYGLLESFSLLGALLVLYCLYQYLNSQMGKNQPYFIAANIIYFFTSFIHERYMVLLLPIIVTFFMKGFLQKRKKNEWKLIFLSLFTGLLIIGIRFLAIGSLAPAGTGGTNVSDTFTVAGSLRFAVNQVLYLMGINAGPEYLNGIAWQDVPIQKQLIVVGQIIALAGIILVFLCSVIKDREERKKHFCNSLLFLLFIMMCIGASSVTIRLEMRWVYVSFAVALCYLSYFFKVIKISKSRRRIFYLLMGMYFLCMLPTELFYRGHYPNIYFWDKQKQYNSLAEVTYGSYGTDIFDKNIIILENSFEMDDFSARTFLKPYNKNWAFPNRTITFADSIYDFGMVSNNMLILSEDLKQNRYNDVTALIKKLKCDVSYGYYEDRWMDQQAELSVVAGSEGIIHLTGMFPGVLNGGEEIQVTVNGKETLIFPVNTHEIDMKIDTSPYSHCQLEIAANFYMQDALEQRGDYPLCILVDIKAD